MELCELVLYEELLADYPDDAAYICSVLKGTNRLHYGSGLRAEVEARRMSGDMCTSLGNGFTNWCLFKFICHLKHCSGDGFVEGDDGIFATPAVLTAQDYESCGFTVEIKEIADPCEGHFCGMTFAENGEIIKDPRRVFSTFGWTHSFIHAGHQIMDELLKSKALSLAYELPQCPIVGQLARTALELTAGITANHKEENWHKVPESFKIQEFTPAPATRELFARKFGISVQNQLDAEAAIREHDMDRLAVLIPPGGHTLIYATRYLEVA